MGAYIHYPDWTRYDNLTRTSLQDQIFETMENDDTTRQATRAPGDTAKCAAQLDQRIKVRGGRGGNRIRPPLPPLEGRKSDFSDRERLALLGRLTLII